MIKALTNLFFPETCAGCDTLLYESEYVICTSCRHSIPLTGHYLVIENDAWQKFYGRLPVEHVSAMCYFHKHGIVQQMIHKLKYKGMEDIGTAIGYWYGSILCEVADFSDTVVIPVPLHKRRLRERGYNQVTAFARSLSESLGAELNEKILLRQRYAKTQTRKNLLARVFQNKEMFGVNTEEIIENKHFILVDDVITTGSTLEACGKALLKIPGARISIVCIAMSHS